MSNQLIQFLCPQDVEVWEIVNDQVMGGCSSSKVEWHPSKALNFKGDIRSDNGGGFASIRRLITQNSFSSGLSICFKGKSSIKVKLRTDPFLEGIDYASFARGSQDEWTTVQIPFSDFKPYFRGLQLTDAAPLNPQEIRQIGLLIGEQQYGTFDIQVRSIELF